MQPEAPRRQRKSASDTSASLCGIMHIPLHDCELRIEYVMYIMRWRLKYLCSAAEKARNYLSLFKRANSQQSRINFNKTNNVLPYQINWQLHSIEAIKRDITYEVTKVTTESPFSLRPYRVTLRTRIGPRETVWKCALCTINSARIPIVRTDLLGVTLLKYHTLVIYLLVFSVREFLVSRRCVMEN